MADNSELIKALLAGVKPPDNAMQPEGQNAMPPAPLGFANSLGQYLRSWGSASLAHQPPNWFGQNVLGSVGKVAEAMPPGAFDMAAMFMPGARAAPFANSFRRSPDLPAVWKDAHPRTTVEARLANERPVGAATAYGNDVFVSPHIHGGEYDDALAVLGQDKISALAKSPAGTEDGFITNAGRFLERKEAAGLADAAMGREVKSDPIGLEMYNLQARIANAYTRAKAQGDQAAMANLSQQYRDISERLAKGQ